MPYQLAIRVGAASKAAQPASFLTISPWAIVTIDRFTPIAAVSISRMVSVDSLMRRAWSSTSRKYGRTSLLTSSPWTRVSWVRMSCIGAAASRNRTSSRLSSYSEMMVRRLNSPAKMSFSSATSASRNVSTMGR